MHTFKVDFMLVPSVANQAPQIGSLEPQDPSLIWTLLGIPVMTLPVLNGTGGLPVGLTILGPKYSDYSLHDFSFKHIMPFKSEIVVPNVVMDS